jgi:hypothetical protein
LFVLFSKKRKFFHTFRYFGEQRSTKNYLNIYSIPDLSNVSLDKLITSIDLQFQPLEVQIVDEIIFISGTDKMMHSFIKEKKNYIEVDSTNFYPNLVDLPSSILRFKFYPNFLIVGCQNGHVLMIQKEKKQNIQLDGPCKNILTPISLQVVPLFC